MTRLDERFWAKVDTAAGPNDCWLWQGCRNARGYGRFNAGGPIEPAHRFSLERSLGRALRTDEYACHTCDVKACVNPRHLYAGSASTNARDALTRSPNFGWGKHPRRGEAHHNTTLTAQEVIRLRAEYGAGRLDQYQLARLFHVSQATVSRIVRKVAWSHV